MTKEFTNGLVVGKFAPLHAGHEFLIDAAFDKCENLYIISYCQPELRGFEAWRREEWLKLRYPSAHVLVATPSKVVQWQAAGIQISQIPDNHAKDDIHRRFTALLCSQVFDAKINAVFTSEEYGEGFSKILTNHFGELVTHVMVDLKRSTVPISATRIRNDLHGLREFLPPIVYAHFVRRVAFLGGESTGKTTLANMLGNEFQTRWVAEYGRDLWVERGGELRFSDYLKIAHTQLARENSAVLDAHRFVFCDTTPLTTLLYCLDQFGKADEELVSLANTQYDKIFLCAPDFPLVQDGTRRDEAFRMGQHAWYLKALAEQGVNFTLLTGSLKERIVQIKKNLK